jgi:hypothetical protein
MGLVAASECEATPWTLDGAAAEPIGDGCPLTTPIPPPHSPTPGRAPEGAGRRAPAECPDQLRRDGMRHPAPGPEQVDGRREMPEPDLNVNTYFEDVPFYGRRRITEERLPDGSIRIVRMHPVRTLRNIEVHGGRQTYMEREEILPPPLPPEEAESQARESQELYESILRDREARRQAGE